MKDQIHGLTQEDEASLQRQLGGKKEEHLWNKTESRKRVDLYGLQQRRENKSGDGTHRGKSGFSHSCDLCSFTTNTRNSMKGLRKQQLKITQPITPITLLVRYNDRVAEFYILHLIFEFLIFFGSKIAFCTFLFHGTIFIPQSRPKWHDWGECPLAKWVWSVTKWLLSDRSFILNMESPRNSFRIPW